MFQIQGADSQQDFLSTSKSGFFLDGQTQTTVNFDLIDDNNPEDDESYTVVLVVPTTGGVVPELGMNKSLTLTILKNDDANGVVSFATVSGHCFVACYSCMPLISGCAVPQKKTASN